MSKSRHTKRAEQRARARLYVYLYGSDREGASSAAAFAGGASGGYLN